MASIITAAALDAVLDELTRFHLRAVGSQASGYGYGTKGGSWGCAGAVQNLKAVVLAIDDTSPVKALVGPVESLENYTYGDREAGNDLASIITALEGHISLYQIPNVRTLNDYLTYLNTGTGGTWLALQHNDFYALYSAIKSSYPSIWNLYFEVLQSATYTSALGKFIVSGAGVGTFTGAPVAGGLVSGSGGSAQIDTAKYAGSFPQLNVSGLAGSGLVTITGDAFDPATKSVQTGKTWTANVSANGITALSAGTAPANSLIVHDTNIAIASGITAGTIYCEGARPAGRPLLP